MENTTIEKIGLVYVVQRLPPDMTIFELLFSNDKYAVGIIATIIVTSQYNNRQFDFYIKDGETTNDHATVKTITCIDILSLQNTIFNIYIYIHVQNASRSVSFQPLKNINKWLFLSSIATSRGTI